MRNDERNPSTDALKRQITTRLALWGAGVAVASATGMLSKVPARLIGPLILGGIVAPTVAYAKSPRLKTLAREVGIHNLSLFHTWRVVGTAAFLHYGSKNELPPAFVRNAAWGDLIASTFAAALVVLPRNRTTYLAFHTFGFADFVTALATGLTLTLRGDDRMRTIATFPLALIPLFGVGLSGAAHLIAFDLLREASGGADSPAEETPPAISRTLRERSPVRGDRDDFRYEVLESRML